jgi:hypothetical protein
VFAAMAACVSCSPFATAADDDLPPTTWVVRSIASDTTCAVLDDGRRTVLRCVGDHAGDPETRLVRIEGQSAVFAIDGGRASPLHVRVAVGASFAPDVLRARAMEAMGPRPGWIATEPVVVPEQVP